MAGLLKRKQDDPVRNPLFDIPQTEEKKRKMREEEGGIKRLISARGHEIGMKTQKPSYMGNTPTIDSAMQLLVEKSGHPIRPIDTGSNENTSIMSVAISKLGDKTAFGCSCGSVYYTNASRKITRFPTNSFTYAVAFTNDGKNIIAGTNKGMLIFNTDTGSSTPITSEGQQWVMSIAVHPTRDDIFVVGYYNRGAIKVFGLTAPGNWTLAATLTHGNGMVGYDAVNSVAFSPDGTNFYSGGSDGMVNVWDFSSRALVGTIVHINDPGSFATVNSLVITTEHIISAGGDGVIKVWGKSDGASKSSTICVPIGEGRGYSINDMAFANGMLAVVVERWGADHTSAGENVFLYILDSNGVLTPTQQFRGPTPFKSVAIGPYYGIGASKNSDDVVVKAGGTGGFIITLANRGSRPQRHWLKKGFEASDKRYAAAAAEGRSLAGADEELGEFAAMLVNLPKELQDETSSYLGGKRTKRRRKNKQKRKNKKNRTTKHR